MKNCRSQLPLPQPAQGFSLFEVLIVIAGIAILASGAFLAASRTHDSVVSAKLQNDVLVINSAIKVYLASDGSLEGVTNPQQILDKLKTVRVAETASKYAGLRQNMLDPRLAAHLQTEPEAATDQPRAVWNAGKTRFDIVDSGPAGVNFFFLNPDLAIVNYGSEERGRSAIDYNQEDGWIWTYADTAAESGPTPTPIPVVLVAGSAGSSGTGSGTGSSGSGPGSTGSGSSGTGSGNGSSSGTGDSSGDGGSGSDGGDPNPSPERLSPPLFSLPNTQNTYASFPLTLELTNPNVPSSSWIRYSFNGEPWQQYTGSISIPPGTQIYAQAVSLDTQRWTDSLIAVRQYSALLDNLAGFVQGGFNSPIGGPDMEQTITNGGSIAQFSWGTTTYRSDNQTINLGPQSSLIFSGHPFSGVGMETPFLVGNLTYYNGTILENTGAERVSLSLSFDVSSPTEVTLPVDYTFELVNTVNNDSDPIGSADYVRLTAQTGIVQQEIGGILYQVELFFGNSTSQGYTTVNEFHVLENEQASAELFAIVTPLTDLSAAQLSTFPDLIELAELASASSQALYDASPTTPEAQ